MLSEHWGMMLWMMNADNDIDNVDAYITSVVSFHSQCRQQQSQPQQQPQDGVIVWFIIQRRAWTGGTISRNGNVVFWNSSVVANMRCIKCANVINMTRTLDLVGVIQHWCPHYSTRNTWCLFLHRWKRWVLHRDDHYIWSRNCAITVSQLHHHYDSSTVIK